MLLVSNAFDRLSMIPMLICILLSSLELGAFFRLDFDLGLDPVDDVHLLCDGQSVIGQGTSSV